MGALGLASIMETAARADSMLSPLAPKSPQFPGRAKQVIHLFMGGGPSHVDTFDPKPALAKYAGKSLKEIDKSVTRPGIAFPSPFKFDKYGQSGIEISEVFPHLAEHADDMTIIRSMQTGVPSHEIAMLTMNTGESRFARPSVGSWVTYGLGTENQNLPGFIALSPNGRPLLGDQNWQSAFLPGAYQGTFVETRFAQPDKLIEYIRSSTTSLPEQRRQIDLLCKLEQEHAKVRAEEGPLESRIQSFETAFRMQIEATDAFDISKEPADIRALYGDTPQGRQLLITRRLIERGVRFVQPWHVGWDHHSQIEKGLRDAAKACDQPIAALMTDLKQRGLLDETLIVWGGEFGRTPTSDGNLNVDNSKGRGRDHNATGFSIWMAGGGVKGGYVHGATDQFGFAAVDNKVEVADLHATILQLLGFDHKKLTYRYEGRDFRLTGIEGNVVREILA
ncbi:MAG TPA: DUF1501 domain-containing protein [Verrucomicrobiae bacterium]|nr:DUF1501 domain-containing protein [Verrucomicrobiae bacterium]